MPVYNGEKYLREAIESILSQTFSDYTFLIIDDGSTDNSANIIRSYSDPRITLVINEINLGISKTLNFGIEHSSTKYLARMDQDDISLPKRIEEQVNFMESHPDIGVCGAWITAFGANGTEYVKKLPTNNDDIKVALLFNNPMAHPTIMMRKSTLDKFGLRYDPLNDGLEDYDLWERAANVTKLANIPRALLRYRLHPVQLSRTSSARQEKMNIIQGRQYEKLGLKNGEISSLFSANNKKHIYNNLSLRKAVYGIYYKNLKSYIKALIK